MRPRMPIAPAVVSVAGRRPSWLRCRARITGPAAALAVLFVFAPSVASAQLRSGTDCGCSQISPFVDPNPGKAPYIDASGNSAASSPRYHVEALPVTGGWVNVVRTTPERRCFKRAVSGGASPPIRIVSSSGPGPSFRPTSTTSPRRRSPISAPLAAPSRPSVSRFSDDGRFLLMVGLIFGGTQAQASSTCARRPVRCG